MRIKGRFIRKETQGELLRQFIGTSVSPEAVSASKNLESGSLQKMIDNYQKELHKKQNDKKVSRGRGGRRENAGRPARDQILKKQQKAKK